MDRPARPGLRWTTEDQWHVTLRFLGEMETAGEEALRAGLARIAGEVSAVEAAAGPRPRALGPGCGCSRSPGWMTWPVRSPRRRRIWASRRLIARTGVT